MRETNEKIFGVYYETQFNTSVIEIGKLIGIRDVKGTVKSFKDKDGNFNAFVKDRAVNFIDVVIVEVTGKTYTKRINVSHLEGDEFEIDRKYLNEVQTFLLDRDIFTVGKALLIRHGGNTIEGIVTNYNGDSVNLLIANPEEPHKAMSLKIPSKDLLYGNVEIIQELI